MKIELNFKFWVEVAGDAAVLLLLAMPVFFTFPKMKREQSVGTMLCLPFALTWMNAVAFVFYAANKEDWLVAGINAVAFFVESWYCVRYYRYSAGWRRTLAKVMGGMQVVFLAGMFALQFTVFKNSKNEDARDKVYGILGAVTAFGMYASTINQAIGAFSTKDVAGLELAWGFLANASIWTLYSRLSPMDLYLLIANAIGVAFTFFQCVVWLVFRNHKPQAPPA